MVKKLVAVLLAFTLCFSLFSACGQKSNTAAEQTTKETVTTVQEAGSEDKSDPNAEAFTISCANWMLKPGSANADEFKAMIEEKYKSKYPNATIDWALSNTEKYFEVIKAKLASNSGPDVFFHQDKLVLLGSGGYLMDLSDQSWVNDIVDATKPSCIYKGKVLAFPYDLGGWGIYYNKKVFSDLGIQSTPKTFAEFTEICEKIKAAGLDPLICGFKDMWMASGAFLSFASFVYGQDKLIGKNIYDGKAKFNGPEIKAAYDALQLMVQKGYLSKRTMSTTADQGMQLLGEGKAAMMFNGPWCVGIIKERYNTETGFFTIPDENGYNCASAMANSVVSINAQTKNRDRAFDFFNLIIDKDSINMLDKNSALSPLKGFEIEHDSNGMKECGAVFASQESTWQMNMWAPPAILEKLQQLTLKIAAGKGYTDQDLDDLDKAYQKDKALLDPSMFDLLK